MDDVLLVNLETGESIMTDHYTLMERDIPEGFTDTADLTAEMWVASLQAALKKEQP